MGWLYGWVVLHAKCFVLRCVPNSITFYEEKRVNVCASLYAGCCYGYCVFCSPAFIYSSVHGRHKITVNQWKIHCMYVCECVCVCVCGCSKLRFSLYVYVCVYFVWCCDVSYTFVGCMRFSLFYPVSAIFLSFSFMSARGVAVLRTIHFILSLYIRVYIHTRVYDFEFYLNVNVNFVYENDERSPIYWIIIGFWNFSNDFRNLHECNVPTAFYAHIRVNIRLYIAGIYIFIYNVTKNARWFAFMKCTEQKLRGVKFKLFVIIFKILNFNIPQKNLFITFNLVYNRLKKNLRLLI